MFLSLFVVVAACEDNGNAIDRYEEIESRASILGTYQAEDHTFQSGCTEESKKKGYTGRGYMDYGRQGSLVEWSNVNVPSAGKYTLTFRYANGSGEPLPLAQYMLNECDPDEQKN